MAMDLLQKLAVTRLPTTVYGREEVDKVKVLRAAGLVTALTLRPPGLPQGSEAAQVLVITAKGWEELSSVSPGAAAKHRRLMNRLTGTAARFPFSVRRRGEGDEHRSRRS